MALHRFRRAFAPVDRGARIDDRPCNHRLGRVTRVFRSAALIFLGLTLPPLLCRPEDVARTSAGMFTISYSGAVAVAVASGAAWT